MKRFVLKAAVLLFAAVLCTGLAETETRASSEPVSPSAEPMAVAGEDQVFRIVDQHLSNEGKGQVENYPYANVLPVNLEMNVGEILKCTVLMETDIYGTSTYEVTVGVDVENASKLKNSWQTYKNQIKKFKKTLDLLNTGNQYKFGKKLTRQSFPNKSLRLVKMGDFSILPEVTVLGYMEMKTDINGHVISCEGSLLTGAQWDCSIGWQFLTAIGPVYVSFGGEADVQMYWNMNAIANLIISACNQEKETVSSPSGSSPVSAEVDVKLKPEVGYGVYKAITIGLSGGYELDVNLEPHGKSRGELLIGGYVHVFFLGFEGEFPITGYRGVLWDSTGRAAGNREQLYSQGSTGSFHPADRSYLEERTEWNGGGYSRISQAGAEQSLVLQKGIMPNSVPLIREIGGTKVMVFEADASERSGANRSCMMYSVEENGRWSTPKAIWDTGTYDFLGDLEKVGNSRMGEELYVTWTKLREVMPDTGDAREYLKKAGASAEICFARFDPVSKTFVDACYLTNDTDADSMPQIVRSMKPTVSWVKNTDGSLMQETGSSQIIRAQANVQLGEPGSLKQCPNWDSWEAGSFTEEAVVTTEGTVEQFVDFGERLLYSSKEPSASGDEDPALFDETGTCVSRDLGYIETILDTDQDEYVSAGGELYRYVPGSQPEKAERDGAGTGSRVQWCAGTADQDGSLVWSEYEEATDSTVIYRAALTQNRLYEPVEICRQEGLLQNLSVCLSENGSWTFAANRYDQESGLCELICVETAESPAELAAAVQEDDFSLECFVVNHKDRAERYSLTVKDRQGNVCGEETVYLEPYGSDSVQVPVYPNIAVGQETQLTVSVLYEAEPLTQANTKTVAWKRNTSMTLSLTASYIQTKTDLQVTTNAMLLDGWTLYCYGNPDRSAVVYQTSSAQEASSFVIPKETIPYGENQAAYLFLDVVDANGNSVVTEDSYRMIILYKDRIDLHSAIMSNGIRLSADEFVYDGREKCPRVYIGGLTEGTDYTVEYYDNREIGTAVAVVRGMGTYYGTDRMYFKITESGGGQPGVSYYGDVNQNGQIEVIDAISILKYLVKIVTDPVREFNQEDSRALLLADADQSGKIDVSDALTVLRILVNLSPKKEYLG